MLATLLLLIAVAAGSPMLVGTAFGADLLRDDFSRYPPGHLSTPVGELNAAIQEYHYLPHRGVPLGPWANAIGHLDAWVAGDEDGKPYLEQHLTSDARQYAIPIFVTGDGEWSAYTVEARVKPLALNGMAGVVFRYHTNRHYYLFALTGGKEIWSVPAPSVWAAVRLKNGNTLISGNQRGYAREVDPKGETVWEINKDDLPGIPLYTVQEVSRLANGNTLINNRAGSLPLEQWSNVVQLIEVTPDKKVVWALRDWNTLGPATSTQLLDEPGVPENGDLQR